MTSLERINDEVSSLHGSNISLASGSNRYQSIDERQPLQNGDQVNLGNATTALSSDSSRPNETTQDRQAVKQKPKPTRLRTVLTNSWLHEIASLIASWACQIWLVVILFRWIIALSIHKHKKSRSMP